MGLTIALLVTLQVAHTGVEGAVRDRVSGAPLAHATVALTDANLASVTDSLGRFSFRDLPPGPHHLSVRRDGFESRTLHVLVPRGGVLSIDVALEPDPIELEGLTVAPPLPLPGAEAAEAHAGERVMTIAAVRNHPLLSEPDILTALDGGTVAIALESPAGVHIRGGSADQTSYAIDGIPVLIPYHSAGVFGALNPDVLSTVRLRATGDRLPASLSGTIEADTRRPGSRLRTQATASTTQSRLTLDGPLASTGWGMLVGIRKGFPGGVLRPEDPGKLRGEAGDWLAKVAGDLGGGRLTVLGFGGEDELSALSAVDPGSDPAARLDRNHFGWKTSSYGASWRRDLSAWSLDAQLWRADAATEADFRGPASRAMSGARTDDGASVTVRRDEGRRSSTLLSLTALRSKTSYVYGEIDTDRLRIAGRSRALALLGRRTLPLSRVVGAGVEVGLIASSAGVRFSPGLRIEAEPVAGLEISGVVARRHQLSQSVRNEESLFGGVFPADLFISSAVEGVPIARSDEAIVGIAYRPQPGASLGAEAYVRRLDGLVIVATRDPDPFATQGFDVGTGRVTGITVDGALAGSRYGALARYTWQRVRRRVRDVTYAPGHGTQHRMQAGVTLYPSPTLALKTGMTGAWGRRGTSLAGGLEYESCNLLDGGCEFEGSAPTDPSRVGRARLPRYLRVDLGFRKHWHVRAGGRDGSVALYATVSNLFGRRNVLTFAPDPATGELDAIEMVPLAPLVIGIDIVF